MPTTDTGNLINLSEADRDMPIYRIYALDRFLSLLRMQEDALVNPEKWEDPFENFLLSRTEVVDGQGRKGTLRNLAQDWYGQCWSVHEETDAMWRIYSGDRAHPGVKVKTTIGKLFDNLKALGSLAPYLQFFVGRVRYLSEMDIQDFLTNSTLSSFTSGGGSNSFAKMLCIKREAFAHEAEVRLLYHDLAFGEPTQIRGKDGVLRYPLDANRVLKEVVIDPRLEERDAADIEASLYSAGCRLPISQSNLYRVPRFTISLN